MRRLSIVLWLLLISIVFVQAKTYVVCVGIADYPGKSADLRVSDNDAKTIAKVFLATKDASVRILVNEQATQSALLSTMHATFEDANHNDAVILFFSGHGAPGALACYDGLLTYQHIFRMLKGCKAKRKIIIADACYSGKMRTNKQHSTHHTSQNVMFFLSSRSNEESQETKYKNSLFTIFLERGLRGGADKNRDRKITAQELFNFVHYGVIDWSKGGQHPVMWGKFDNDMTIIKWK